MIGYDKYGNQYDSLAGQMLIWVQHRGYYEGQKELHERYKRAMAKRRRKKRSIITKVKGCLRRFGGMK